MEPSAQRVQLGTDLRSWSATCGDLGRGRLTTIILLCIPLAFVLSRLLFVLCEKLWGRAQNTQLSVSAANYSSAKQHAPFVCYELVEPFNSGHFYAEDLPNIIMFNVTHLRPRSSVSQSTVNAYRARWESNSFLALARELSPQLTPHFSADCDEGVYRTQYGAAMSWIHTHLVPQRVLHLHRPPQRQAIIAQMIEHCKINPQKKSYDVIIFNRPKERNRSILNLEVLVAQVRQLGYNVYQIPIGALYKLSQCQILSMFSSGKAVIGPYGSDLTYPLMLRIHTFSVLHYTAEDRFYSEFITLLGGGAYAYKQIYAGNTQNGSLRKFRAPLTEHGNHNFQSEMIRNYLEKNIELTDDNIQELVELVQLVVPQK